MCRSTILFLVSIILYGCVVVPQKLPKLYRENISAVVSIHVAVINPYTGKTKIILNGSGFIIDKQKGLIITAAHVVKTNKTCRVEFSTGLKVDGIIKFIDESNDIAIINVNSNNFIRDTPNLKFELNPTIGESLFCIGSAGGYTGIVSFGILSSGLIIERDVMSFCPNKYYLSDIHIIGGNSGCPVFNFENKVVGMVTQFMGSYVLMIPARVMDKVLKNASN